MTQTFATPSRREQRAIAKARRILGRIEQLDTWGCCDLQNTRQHELAVLRLEIDLLESRYLTVPGLRYVEHLIGHSEQWIDDAEANEAEEE